MQDDFVDTMKNRVRNLPGAVLGGVQPVNSLEQHPVARLAQAWKDAPRTLLSLWDMNEFLALHWGLISARLDNYENATAIMADISPGSEPDEKDKSEYAFIVQGAFDMSVRMGMETSAHTAKSLLDRLKGETSIPGCSNQYLHSQFESLSKSVSKEFVKRKFVFIKSDAVEFFEQKHLFGEPVSKAFPSAAPHIKDAGNCRALELYTASVFHLMIAAEFGLRALAKRLGVKTKRPIEFEDWGTVIEASKTKLKTFSARTKIGRVHRTFYHNAVDNCEYLKDVWRNNIMHANARSDALDCPKAFEKTKEFMQSLASNRFRETI